ncbi:MAG: FeoB-associated Cys-rich membrane protein [Planctomycetia bacterium]|jgi:hypothetical protein|nr:FeoB-associated Cys-rich membrane protein [Planctomycetia bacterium]
MNWQEYLAIGFFTAAAIYVAWRAWRALFSAAKTGCGSGCGSCSSAQTQLKSGDLLKIEMPTSESRRS